MANAERNERIGGLERPRVALIESGTRYHIGIDLAWADESRRKANESGIVMLDPAGDVAAADWTIGIDETMAWLDGHAPADALLSVDAPLVVNNEAGQRRCEKEVGQRYGRWKVSANSTNCKSRHLAGVELLGSLAARGWTYHDGTGGPPVAQDGSLPSATPTGRSSARTSSATTRSDPDTSESPDACPWPSSARFEMPNATSSFGGWLCSGMRIRRWTC